MFLFVFVCFFIHHHRVLLDNHNIHLWVCKQCYWDLFVCFCLFLWVFLSVHMQVKVNNEVATGTGPNKKVAKRNAAEAMLLQLGYKASTVLQNTTDVWTLLVFTPTCICDSQFKHVCHCSFILLFQSSQFFVRSVVVDHPTCFSQAPLWHPQMTCFVKAAGWIFSSCNNINILVPCFLLTAKAFCVIFSGCPSVCPILVNKVFFFVSHKCPSGLKNDLIIFR